MAAAPLIANFANFTNIFTVFSRREALDDDKLFGNSGKKWIVIANFAIEIAIRIWHSTLDFHRRHRRRRRHKSPMAKHAFQAPLGVFIHLDGEFILRH